MTSAFTPPTKWWAWFLGLGRVQINLVVFRMFCNRNLRRQRLQSSGRAGVQDRRALGPPLLHYAYRVSLEPDDNNVVAEDALHGHGTGQSPVLHLRVHDSMSLPRSASSRRDKRSMLLKWLLVAPARRWALG